MAAAAGGAADASWTGLASGAPGWAILDAPVGADPAGRLTPLGALIAKATVSSDAAGALAAGGCAPSAPKARSRWVLRLAVGAVAGAVARRTRWRSRCRRRRRRLIHRASDVGRRAQADRWRAVLGDVAQVRRIDRFVGCVGGCGLSRGGAFRRLGRRGVLLSDHRKRCGRRGLRCADEDRRIRRLRRRWRRRGRRSDGRGRRRLTGRGAGRGWRPPVQRSSTDPAAEGVTSRSEAAARFGDAVWSLRGAVSQSTSPRGAPAAGGALVACWSATTEVAGIAAMSAAACAGLAAGAALARASETDAAWAGPGAGLDVGGGTTSVDASLATPAAPADCAAMAASVPRSAVASLPLEITGAVQGPTRALTGAPFVTRDARSNAEVFTSGLRVGEGAALDASCAADRGTPATTESGASVAAAITESAWASTVGSAAGRKVLPGPPLDPPGAAVPTAGAAAAGAAVAAAAPPAACGVSDASASLLAATVEVVACPSVVVSGVCAVWPRRASPAASPPCLARTTDPSGRTCMEGRPVVASAAPPGRPARLVAGVAGSCDIRAASADEKPSPPPAVAVASPGAVGVTLVLRLEAASMAPVVGFVGSGACCAETFGPP